MHCSHAYHSMHTIIEYYSIIVLYIYAYSYVCLVCCRLVGLYVTHVHTQRAFSIFGKIRREQQQWKCWNASSVLAAAAVGACFSPFRYGAVRPPFSDTWAPHPQNRWGNKSFEITRKTRASAERSGSLRQRERARCYVVSSRGKWWVWCVVSLQQKYPLFERTS